jgi:hypothetical protein
VSQPSGGASPIGTRYGPYVVVGELGRGNMGVVYLARHVELGNTYAVKVLGADLAHDPEQLARFEREMAALARFDHPGVVRVHSAGVQEGRPYFVMEHVVGQSLRQAQRGGLPPEAAFDVLEQVAETLAHAHAQGLVHRDVKPDNVLVGADGRARLADFGLVKALHEKAERLTRTGDVVGTPAYMAPEQVSVDLGGVGPWTDVFALGAALYEVLGGRPPYLSATSVEIYEKLMDGAPIPPLPDTVDPALAEVVLKALAHEPTDRYRDGGELLAALRAARAEPTRVHVARTRALATFAAAGLGLGLIGVVWSLAPEGEPGGGPSPDPVAAPSDQAPGDPEAAAVAWRRGNTREARQLLGGAAAPERAEILALAGEHRAALDQGDLPPEAQARVAMWLGDLEAAKAALEQLPRGPRRALAWELGGATPALRPSSGDLPSDATGSEALAVGEEALARGVLTLAARAFGAEGPDDAPPVARGLALGRARVALARGALAHAARHWRSAWEGVGDDPSFERAHLVAWGALIAKAGPKAANIIEGVLREDPLERARREAPGHPLTLRALGEAAGADSPLRRARALARAGDDAGAQALLHEHLRELRREDGGPALGSFARLERAALLHGLDDGPGAWATRGILLAEQAEQGGDPRTARRAVELLRAVAPLHSGSPALAVAAARAGLVLRKPGPVSDALRRTSGAERDPALLEMAARSQAVQAAGLGLTSDQRTLRGDPNPGLAQRAAAAWTRAREAAERALAAAQGADPLADRCRILAARASMEAARHAREAIPAQQVEGLLRPLRDAAGVEALVARRRELVTALQTGEGVPEAERALSSAVAGLDARWPAIQEALRLLAHTGDARAAAASLAAADLEARGLFLARCFEGSRGQEAEALLERGRALLPPPQLLLAGELRRLDPEGVKRFLADPERVLDVGRALAGAPQLTGLALAAFRAQPPEEAAKALPAEGPRAALGLARALVWLTARDAPSPRGARRALVELEAAARAPGAPASVHVLRAVALRRLGGPSELKDALRAAEAGAPFADVVHQVAFKTPEDVTNQTIDELFSRGYLTNHLHLAGPFADAEVRAAVEQLPSARAREALQELDLESGSRAQAIYGELLRAGVFPRLALALIVTEGPGRGFGPDDLTAAERLVEAGRLDGAGAQSGRLALVRGRFAWGLDPELRPYIGAGEACLAGLRELGAGGDPLPLSRPCYQPELLPGAGSSKVEVELLARTRPAQREAIERLEFRARDRGTLREELLRARARARVGDPPPPHPFSSEGLQAPWGRGRAALAGPRAGDLHEEVAEWFAEVGAWEEVHLAVLRAAAFSRGPTSQENYVESLHEAFSEFLYLAEGEDRARGFAHLEGGVREGLALCRVERQRQALHGLLVDCYLERAGRAQGEERGRLLRLALEEIRQADPDAAEYYTSSRWVAWRRLRAFGALDRRQEIRQSRQRMREALRRRSSRDLRQVETAARLDPLRPLLEEQVTGYMGIFERRR